MFRIAAFATTFLICNLILLSDVSSEQATSALTGDELVQYCEASRADFDKGFCAGFVTSAWNDFLSVREQRYTCDPPDATIEQATQVVQKYLADHPDELNEKALVLIFDALDDAFPCPW